MKKCPLNNTAKKLKELRQQLYEFMQMAWCSEDVCNHCRKEHIAFGKKKKQYTVDTAKHWGWLINVLKEAAFINISWKAWCKKVDAEDWAWFDQQAPAAFENSSK